MIACPLPNSRDDFAAVDSYPYAGPQAALARDHIVKRPERFLLRRRPNRPQSIVLVRHGSPERCDEDSVDKPVRCLRGGRSRLRRLRSSGREPLEGLRVTERRQPPDPRMSAERMVVGLRASRSYGRSPADGRSMRSHRAGLPLELAQLRTWLDAQLVDES